MSMATGLLLVGCLVEYSIRDLGLAGPLIEQADWSERMNITRIRHLLYIQCM